MPFQVTAPYYSYDEPSLALTIWHDARQALPATVPLTIETNDPDNPSWQLILVSERKGAPDMAVQRMDTEDYILPAEDLIFDTVEQGLAHTVTLRLLSTGSRPLASMTTSLRGAAASEFTVTKLSTSSLAAGQSQDVQVTYRGAKLGAREAQLVIQGSPGFSRSITLRGQCMAPEIALKLEGKVLDDNTGRVDFGTSIDGAAAVQREIMVENLGTAPLQLGTVVMDGADADAFSAAPWATPSLAPGASTPLTLTFQSGKPGDHRAVLHMVNNDANESPFDLKLTASVQTPELAIEESSGAALSPGDQGLDFGAAEPGSSQTRALILRNLGNRPLNLQPVELGGADASRFILDSSWPSTIAAKGRVQVTLRFTPDDLRAFAAVLRIRSDDPDEADLSLDLGGTGADELLPVITSPEARIAALGSSVTFSAQTSSPTALRLQWSRGSKTYSPIAGATLGSLTLPNVKLADAAQLYRLSATNAAGTRHSTPAALTVVDTAPARQNLLRGGKAVFSIQAASTGTLTFRWLKGGAAMPADERISGTDQRQLVITDLEATDAGVYTCEITGPGGALTGGAQLLTIFETAPQIEGSPLIQLPPAEVARDYAFTIPLSGSGGSATRFTATPLPAGLRVDTATGVISGRPTAASTPNKPFRITLTAANAEGTSTSAAELVVGTLVGVLPGDYMALVERGDATEGLGARLDLTITAGGTFSGRVLHGGKTWSLAPSVLNVRLEQGRATGETQVSRTSKAAWDLSFIISTADSRITEGTLSSPNLEACELSGFHNRWLNRAPLDHAGYHTVALTPPVPVGQSQQLPRGHGYGSMTIPANGKSYPVSGWLPDGESYTCSTFTGPAGEVLLHAPLKSAGTLHGRLVIPLSAAGYLQGELDWNRPPQPGTPTYAAGFLPTALLADGGRYSAPATGALPLGKPAPATAGNASLVFMDGGLGGFPSRADRLIDLRAGAAPLKLPAAGASRTTFIFTPATGLFHGTFTLWDPHPVSPGAAPITRQTSFRGILVNLPEGQRGLGGFLLPALPAPVFPQPKVQPNLSGAVYFQ